MSHGSFSRPHVKLITVQTVQGHTLAEMLKSKLEGEGIPVALRYQSVGRVLGITVDGLGQVEIQVPEEMVEKARAALAEDEPAGPSSQEPPTQDL